MYHVGRESGAQSCVCRGTLQASSECMLATAKTSSPYPSNSHQCPPSAMLPAGQYVAITRSAFVSDFSVRRFSSRPFKFQTSGRAGSSARHLPATPKRIVSQPLCRLRVSVSLSHKTWCSVQGIMKSSYIHVQADLPWVYLIFSSACRRPWSRARRTRSLSREQ